MPNSEYRFSVVCEASDFDIGSALLQTDAEGRERAIAIESRQLKAADKGLPVHDKALLAMKYTLVKFRFNCLAQAIRRRHGSCVVTQGYTVASPLLENGSLDFLLC